MHPTIWGVGVEPGDDTCLLILRSRLEGVHVPRPGRQLSTTTALLTHQYVSISPAVEAISEILDAFSRLVGCSSRNKSDAAQADCRPWENDCRSPAICSCMLHYCMWRPLHYCLAHDGTILLPLTYHARSTGASRLRCCSRCAYLRAERATTRPNIIGSVCTRKHDYGRCRGPVNVRAASPNCRLVLLLCLYFLEACEITLL